MFFEPRSVNLATGSVAIDCSVAASRSLEDWCRLRVAGNVTVLVIDTASCALRHCCAARGEDVKVDSGRVRDAEHLWKAQRIVSAVGATPAYYNWYRWELRQ